MKIAIDRETLLDEKVWEKEDHDIAMRKSEICREHSIHKLISALYERNEGIGKIALSKLLEVCRNGHKDNLIEIIVHHILNAAQHGLVCKSGDFLRASFWVIVEIQMDESLTRKVIDITSKKIPVLAREASEIADKFVEDLKSKLL
jgi:hypothetical protein